MREEFQKYFLIQISLSRPVHPQSYQPYMYHRFQLTTGKSFFRISNAMWQIGRDFRPIVLVMERGILGGIEVLAKHRCSVSIKHLGIQLGCHWRNFLTTLMPRKRNCTHYIENPGMAQFFHRHQLRDARIFFVPRLCTLSCSPQLFCYWCYSSSSA